jgi:hypothetical protein
VRACVLMAGGAALAAAVASCACVLIHELLLEVLASLYRCAMRRFRRRSRLADVVGALVGFEVVSGFGALVGVDVNALIALLMTLLIALVIR